MSYVITETGYNVFRKYAEIESKRNKEERTIYLAIDEYKNCPCRKETLVQKCGLFENLSEYYNFVFETLYVKNDIELFITTIGCKNKSTISKIKREFEFSIQSAIIHHKSKYIDGLVLSFSYHFVKEEMIQCVLKNKELFNAHKLRDKNILGIFGSNPYYLAFQNIFKVGGEERFIEYLLNIQDLETDLIPVWISKTKKNIDRHNLTVGKYQKALMSMYFFGLNCTDIAKDIGVTSAAIRNNFHKIANKQYLYVLPRFMKIRRNFDTKSKLQYIFDDEYLKLQDGHDEVTLFDEFIMNFTNDNPIDENTVKQLADGVFENMPNFQEAWNNITIPSYTSGKQLMLSDVYNWLFERFFIKKSEISMLMTYYLINKSIIDDFIVSMHLEMRRYYQSK